MSNSDPLVSVIVPVHNVEGWLDLALESLLRQSYIHWEAQLVDDGSTDRSAEIARQWAERDGRFHVTCRPNGGISVARNTGLDRAGGEFIAFLDADDELEPDALEILVGAARRSGASIVIGGFRRISTNGNDVPHELPRIPGMAPGRIYPPATMLRAYLKNRIAPVVWDALYRKELFSEHRFPAGVWHEDSFLRPRLLGASPCTAVVHDIVYRYRVRPGSFMETMNVGRLDAIRARESLRDEVYARFSDSRTRALAESSIVGTIGWVHREICRDVEWYPASERRGRYRWWRRKLYAVIPRSDLFSIAVNPWTTGRAKVAAILMLIDLRAYRSVVHGISRFSRALPFHALQLDRLRRLV